MPQKKLTSEEKDKRIKELEKELEYEKMKAITYNKMIDVAERMFDLPIRKKLGAKQFKK
ncbi:MAG: hypothetical protein R3Y26_11160 [Rikenellaceae bacterium]